MMGGWWPSTGGPWVGVGKSHLVKMHLVVGVQTCAVIIHFIPHISNNPIGTKWKNSGIITLIS